MNYWNGFCGRRSDVRKEATERKMWQDRLHALIIDELNKEDNRRLVFEWAHSVNPIPRDWPFYAKLFSISCRNSN